MLGPDDLGVVRAREEQAAAVAAMTQVLGPPTSTTPGTCHAGAPALRVARTRHALLLKTAAGATLGMTLAQVRPLYPPDPFSAEQGGRIALGGTKAGDRLFLGFFDQAPNTPLTEIKGGATCGDF